MIITFCNASPPSVSDKNRVKGPPVGRSWPRPCIDISNQAHAAELLIRFLQCSRIELFASLWHYIWLKKLTLGKNRQCSGPRGSTRNLQISGWRPEVCTQQDLQYRFCFIHSKCFYMEMFTHDVKLVKQKESWNLNRPNKMLHQPKLIEFTIKDLIIEVCGSQSKFRDELKGPNGLCVESINNSLSKVLRNKYFWQTLQRK